MKISILICSLKSRSESLTALINSIVPTMGDTYKEEAHDMDFYMCKIIGKEVEIVYCIDNGQMTVGMKRNILLKNCSGEYVAYADDDDKVSADYIPELLQGIATGADVVCFKAAYFVNSVFDRPVLYSKAYRKDYHDRLAYYRIPNHLMCVKRELAMAVKFKQVNFGEDADYARRLLPLIKTEHQIDKVLYSYLFDTHKTETQRK